MKILLLGGNGYLGSVLYPQLSKHDTHSLDLCLFGVDQGYSALQNYCDADISSYDVIICLAGHSSVQMCEYSPARSWTNNVEYFRLLCDKLRKDQKLIYASSASVYGNSKYSCDELMPVNFAVLNNYDLQKITIDLIAAKHINEGKNIIGLRFGTINGISPNTRHELMLNSMVKAAMEKKLINVKNSSMRRAILGINDAVDAILLFVENNYTPSYYNVSSFNSNVAEMAEYVSDALNVPIIDHGQDPSYYNFELTTYKIQSKCGFKAKETIKSIVDGLVQNYHQVHSENRVTDKNFAEYV